MKILDKFSDLWSGDSGAKSIDVAFLSLQKMYPDLISGIQIAYYGRDVRIQLSNGRVIRLRGMAAKFQGNENYEEILASLQDALAMHVELPPAQEFTAILDDSDDGISTTEALVSFGLLVSGGALLVSKADGDAPEMFSAVVFDDPISNAQIYLEEKDGSLTELDGVVTADDGSFEFSRSLNSQNLNVVAKGGTNTATGLENVMTLKAPASSLVINPITSLLVEITDSTDLSLEQAEAKILQAFNLVLPEGESLLTYDPLKAYAEQNQAGEEGDDALTQDEAPVGEPSSEDLAIQKLSSSLMMLMTELGRSDQMSADAFFKMLAVHISSSSKSIDLTDTSLLDSLMVASNDDLATAIIERVVPAIESTQNATSFEQIASIQQAHLDDEASPLPVVSVDPEMGEFTVDMGANVNVSVNGVTLTEQELASKFTVIDDVDTSLSRFVPNKDAFVGGEQILISATMLDIAGAESAEVSQWLIALDTTSPEVSPYVLEDNVGQVQGFLSTGDKTDDKSIVLSGTNEEGSSVEVFNGNKSLGQALVIGTSWSMTIAVEDDTKYEISIRETDAAGNVSAASDSVVFTGDSTSPDAPELSIAGEYNLLSGITRVVSETPISVLNQEQGAAVQYKISSLDSEFNMTPLTEWSNEYIQPSDNGLYVIQARQIDEVGNESDISQLILEVDAYDLVIDGIDYFDTSSDPEHTQDIGSLNSSVDAIAVAVAINQFTEDDSFELVINSEVIATDSPTAEEIDAGIMVIDASIEEQTQDPNWQVKVSAVDSADVIHTDDENITWG